MEMSSKGFTLIELLIVIAIVAILSVTVIFVINPAELLKQSRDSARLSDMDTLNSALSLAELEGLSLGTASTTYFSIVDPNATSSQGTYCTSATGLTAPTGWFYRCAASSTQRNTNGTGWIPVAFTSISTGSPLGALPVDPVNTTSSGQYYSYTPGGSFAVSATLESTKYLTTSAKNDGGKNPGKYEKGSNLSLIARSEGLLGWWDFEEASGSTAQDSSGNGRSGTLANSPTRAAGKVGQALSFNGTNQYVSVPVLSATGGVTVATWFNRSSQDAVDADALFGGWYWAADAQTRQGFDLRFYINEATLSWVTEAASSSVREKTIQSASLSTGAWHHAVGTYDAATGISRLYLNGSLAAQSSANPGENLVLQSQYPDMRIGYSRVNNGYFPGAIDDVRVYSRALTAAEVAAIYNATR